VSNSTIPTRIDELTADWLTESLRSSGVLEAARVTQVKAEALGEGEGFMGEIFRLHLVLDPPEPDAPATLIAKIPTNIPGNRAVGELVGAYEREILFYREYADALPLRTPRVYFADMEAGTSSERDAQGAAIIDKWPIWLIQKLMIFVTWLARRRTRRYVLLIEDFGSAGAGNQVAGCSSQVAQDVLESIAKVHAQYWGEPKLADAHWLRRSDLNPRTMHALFLKHGPSFARNFRERAPVGMDAGIAWLDVNAVELLRALYTSSSDTLLHCDLRLDNVILPMGDRADEPIVFFDWQLAGRGPGAYDVAYFLSGSLAADTPKGADLDLVRSYHAALVANGVSDYALDDCVRDYHRGLLAVLHRISSTDTMDVGSDRGHDLFAIWLERTLARLEGVDFDALIE
jgi:hypothetical protein